jgi:energy-converting hydrogenase Eha subunit C
MLAALSRLIKSGDTCCIAAQRYLRIAPIASPVLLQF